MPLTTNHIFRETDGDVPLTKWLDNLKEMEPRAYVKCVQRIDLLSQLGSELRRPIVDSLREGIRELRAKVGTVNYRILFFFNGRNAVCLSHGLTKEGEVPGAEINLAVKRKKLVERSPEKHVVEWKLE